jgi:hypothetical protein
MFAGFIVQVKLSRYTPWRRLGGEEYSTYSFSTSALDGGEWSASRPGRAFTPGERTHGTHCTGGWVGPRAGLDAKATGKILCLRRGSNPGRPVVQPVVRHYTAWANPVPGFVVVNFYVGMLSWGCLCVQTCSGAHPTSGTMGTGGPFPGAKARQEHDADHSPLLVPRSGKSRSYTSSPPSAFMACSERAFALSFLEVVV